MEDVRCNSFVHYCAARRPGSGVGWRRSSPSPPPACRPRAHKPTPSIGSRRRTFRDDHSIADVEGRVAKPKASPFAIELLAPRFWRFPVIESKSTISVALCEINHMIFNAPGALLAPSGGRCCPGSRQAGASIDRFGIWRRPGDFGRNTGWIQNQVRGFPCRIASRNAASD
jgi:hypothetical protein